MINNIFLIAPSENDAFENRTFVSKLYRYGVYLLFNKKELVYVGKSNKPIARIHTHLNEGEKIFDSYYIHYCKSYDVDNIERFYVKEYMPKYNQTCSNPSRDVRLSEEVEFLISNGYFPINRKPYPLEEQLKIIKQANLKN